MAACSVTLPSDPLDGRREPVASCSPCLHCLSSQQEVKDSRCRSWKRKMATHRQQTEGSEGSRRSAQQREQERGSESRRQRNQGAAVEERARDSRGEESEQVAWCQGESVDRMHRLQVSRCRSGSHVGDSSGDVTFPVCRSTPSLQLLVLTPLLASRRRRETMKRRWSGREHASRRRSRSQREEREAREGEEGGKREAWRQHRNQVDQRSTRRHTDCE